MITNEKVDKSPRQKPQQDGRHIISGTHLILSPRVSNFESAFYSPLPLFLGPVGLTVRLLQPSKRLFCFPPARECFRKDSPN